MFEKLYYIIAWCDWEKMIIKGYIDTSKYIFQTVLSNTAIKRILVSPSTVYADICQYSKKKNRFTIHLLFFFTFKRCTVAKDIYGTFMFDIHADGIVSLILCYHNVLELNFFLRTEFMQWHKSKMVGPKHCNLVGEIYRRCSYMNRRNNIQWFDGGLIKDQV